MPPTRPRRPRPAAAAAPAAAAPAAPAGRLRVVPAVAPAGTAGTAIASPTPVRPQPPGRAERRPGPGRRARRWCGRHRHPRAARRLRPRRAHPAAAHRRQVRLDPGRQGHPAGQGAHLAPPAGGRVRRLAADHRVHVRVLGLRQRSAAGAGQPEPDAEPLQGALVLPGPAGAAHDVPPDGGGCDHPRHGPVHPDAGPLHRQATPPTSPKSASSPSR